MKKSIFIIVWNRVVKELKELNIFITLKKDLFGCFRYKFEGGIEISTTLHSRCSFSSFDCTYQFLISILLDRPSLRVEYPHRFVLQNLIMHHLSL